MPRRRTKIVATVGPASSSSRVLRRMIQAGVNVVRINGSHASHLQIRELTNVVRRLSDELALPVAVMLDLCGPKIRVGAMREGGQRVLPGAPLLIQREDTLGDSRIISCSHKELAGDVRVNDPILLDDGLLELVVREVRANGDVLTEVVVGGELKSRKGINLPGSVVSLPALTKKDLGDLEVGVEAGVDFLAQSFVQTAADVAQLRARLAELQVDDIHVVAKIEKPQAIDNLDEILDLVDGIMVARGDLGVECGPHKVPMLQKDMILRANRRGRFCITATQMLDSMMRNPRPTRAEASDVANAILDGTDAVMLSGETAAGAYPVRSVEMMGRIAGEVEAIRHDFSHHYPTDLATHLGPRYRSICRAARGIGEDERYKAMFVFTMRGTTALATSRHFPRQPVYAFSPLKRTAHQLAMYRGVYPVQMDFPETTEGLMHQAEKRAIGDGLVEAEQEVIMLGGSNEQLGVRNALRLVTLRDRRELGHSAIATTGSFKLPTLTGSPNLAGPSPSPDEEAQ